MACDAQSLINTAYANGYAALSDRDLRECVVASACAGASGGGGGGGLSGEVMEYTGTDPTSDGLVPTNPALPAFAYKRGGTGPSYGWNTLTQTWN